MATSFAAFASQYLTRQQNGNGTSSNNLDSDLDDLDDPHLRASDASRASTRRKVDQPEDDDDPYLRLDEDGALPGTADYGSQSIPLIASSHSSQSPGSPKGWLAHQASPLRSPSLPPSSDSDSMDLERDLHKPSTSKNFRASSGRAHPRSDPPLLPPPSTSRGPISLSLTQSLLPRDGRVRPLDVFSLPDPRYVPRNRRKYSDSMWTVVWLTGVSICFISSIAIILLTHQPSSRPAHLPYTTLLHTVPLITILTFLSAGVAYVHLWLLKVFVAPVMVATSVFIPATLFISAVWAFVGSFMWDANVEPTWGETVGLRIFSIIPLVLSLLTARRLFNLPRQIHTTSTLLSLTSNLLIANPFLLALSPVILLTALVISIPFLTLVFRLLLIGYFSHPPGGGWEWHVKGWANWAIVGTVAIWLWTWGVARGVLQVTSAGVIGAWYFADPTLPLPPPTSTHTIHAAITRATSPSLGTVVLSALLLTLIRLLSLFSIFLYRLPSYIPSFLPSIIVRQITVGIGMGVGWIEGVTSALSKYALVYCGLTGDAFFPSARRARALVAAVDAASSGRYRRTFKTEPPLTLLTIAPLTLSFPFALSTYLFVAHTLSSPDEALGAAVLAGGVTSLVGAFCVGVVRDTADTLYVCYCIDKDVGERRRAEVFDAFEYDSQPTQTQPRSVPSRANQPQPLPSSSHAAPPLARHQAPPNAQPEPQSHLRPSHQHDQHQPQHHPRDPLPPPHNSRVDSPDLFTHSYSSSTQSRTPPPPPQPPQTLKYRSQQSQIRQQPQPRPVSPGKPLQPRAHVLPTDLDEVDPFENSYIDEQEQAASSASVRREPVGYSVSPEPHALSRSVKEDDDEDQLFPGSGIF